MSGDLALRDVVLQALREDAVLLTLVNAVEDNSAAKVTAPAVVMGACTGTEWGARNLKGLSVHVLLTLIDRGDRADRLSAVADRVDAVMDGLPETADDWRIGTVRLDRSRSVRSADGQWSMLVDYVVRLSRLA